MALFIALLLTFFTLPYTDRTTHASVPVLDQIRVALFIQARGTVPTVTISSASPLHLSYKTPSGPEPWVTSSGSFRASLDQYTVIVAQTKQYATANQVLQQISELVKGAYIYEQQLGAEMEYRVAAGPYASLQEAELMRSTFSNLVLAGGRAAMELSGPLYLNAGMHPDQASAEKHKLSLNAAGLRAYSVIHKDAAGSTQHAVWIGGSADEAALNRVKENAQKVVPGLVLIPVNTSLPYMVKLSDVTDGVKSRLPHYTLQSAGTKLWITSDQTIQLKERYGRMYRGIIEIGQYSGSLAVINELPFEQYLYSVVGTEMGGGWPLEALKAQAVAARTYALKQGMKYGIAHISDTTYDQAYKGTSAESPSAVEAVQSTTGEVLVDKDGLIHALYSANAGGVTADESEIWGTPMDYLSSIPSPDQMAAGDKLQWDHVVLPDGKVGFVRTDFTQETGLTNDAGMEVLLGIGEGVNVRAAPYVDNIYNPPIAQINQGDRLIRIHESLESNSFSWVYGPYSGEQLMASIHQRAKNVITGPLQTLEVTKRGPSGRVTELRANGQVVEVTTPDAYRSVLQSIPSTRFDIEAMGNFTILGADGQSVQQMPGRDLYVLTGAQPVQAQTLVGENYLAMSKVGEARLLTSSTMFRFVGLGHGHGLGMSQWGAKELAEFMEYDYKAILSYYYKNVQVVKAQ
jgi:stage II sporulation protein D